MAGKIELCKRLSRPFFILWDNILSYSHDKTYNLKYHRKIKNISNQITVLNGLDNFPLPIRKCISCGIPSMEMETVNQFRFYKY